MIEPSLNTVGLDACIIQEEDNVGSNFLAANIREFLLVVVGWKAVETLLIRYQYDPQKDGLTHRSSQ